MAGGARAHAPGQSRSITLGGVAMKSSIRRGSIAEWLGLSLLAGYVAPALAQTEAASTITKLTAVDVQQTGNPPTGRFAVVVEHDPGLATHTIYRPRELSL